MKHGLKELAEITLRLNINSACMLWFYQPQMPSFSSKFKKDVLTKGRVFEK